MSEKRRKDNFLLKKVGSFLVDKPVWVWWIFHAAVTGALFGIFSLAIYLLGITWWVGVLILLGTGIIWGSIRYSQRNANTREDKKDTGKPE